MAFDDNTILAQRDEARAQLETYKQAVGPMKERIQQFKTNFGVRERNDGSLEVDYDRFSDAIGVEGALELRGIIDEKYSIQGAAGEKPRIRVPSA
jgi:hypothetical protein